MPNKGFSLIEVMVAVTIIALLTVGTVISFASLRVRSREARRISDVTQISDAVDSYNALNGSIPSSDTQNIINNNLQVLVQEGLMKVLPTDPEPAFSGLSGTDRCYNYVYKTNQGTNTQPETSTYGFRYSYYVGFGAEMVGVGATDGDGNLRHPLNANILNSASKTGCNKTRATAFLTGPLIKYIK